MAAAGLASARNAIAVISTGLRMTVGMPGQASVAVTAGAGGETNEDMYSCRKR